MPSNKNKSIGELSPLAKEFFKVFLESKDRFVMPKARAFYRPYKMKDDNLDEWVTKIWEDSLKLRIKMVIIDFRLILCNPLLTRVQPHLRCPSTIN